MFLREIAKRLLTGLKDEIPDLQTRINHILTEQIFGLGLTELTALLSRRTLYCSREADGKYSVCEAFADPQGHIFLYAFKSTNGKMGVAQNAAQAAKCMTAAMSWKATPMPLFIRI